MDKILMMVVLFVAIVGSLALIFGFLLLRSDANLRGWEEGRRENEHYHRLVIDAMRGRIKARERALAMYRDIATTLCNDRYDCMYCPYRCDKNDHKCALWELNEIVKKMDVDKVHVDTKYDEK